VISRIRSRAPGRKDGERERGEQQRSSEHRRGI
jgi:hypothetical protein